MKQLIIFGLLLITTTAFGQEVFTARGMSAIKSAKPYHRIVAREKARIRAERELLGTIKSLKIDANTKMVETMHTSEYKETIVRQIRGVLKGAKITEEKVKGDVSYVTLQITKSDVRKALLLRPFPNQPVSIRNPYVIPGKNFSPQEKLEKCRGSVRTQVTDSVGDMPIVDLSKAEGETSPTPIEQPADAKWKGLIVDGRGIELEEAFWPRILAEDGSVVYGNYDATSDFLQDKGPVKYVNSLAAANNSERVSSPVLSIKALKTAGKYKADLVISKADAEKIRNAEAASKFLQTFKVVVVID